MESNRLIQLIRDQFSEIVFINYEHIKSGWDHDVIILDNKYVFRFPKDREYSGRLSNEISLLKYLSDKTTIDIPRYNFISDKDNFAGYPIIKGEILTKDLINSLDKSTVKSIAGRLVSFLRTLHSMPNEVYKNFELDVNTPSTKLEYICSIIEGKMQTHLNQEDKRWISDFLTKFGRINYDLEENVLLHSDLAYEHIYYDKDSNGLGIIDFSDMSIGDPAHDFNGLFTYGSDFVKSVINEYYGFANNEVFERARMYHMCIPLYLMDDALNGYPCSFDEAYSRFKSQIKIEPLR